MDHHSADLISKSGAKVVSRLDTVVHLGAEPEDRYGNDGDLIGDLREHPSSHPAPVTYQSTSYY